MMKLVNLPKLTNEVASSVEANNLTNEQLDRSTLHQVSHGSSTSSEGKPKSKRTRQTCDFERVGATQMPSSTMPKSIRSPKSRALQEKREPLRDKRATFHSAITKSPTRSPQKNNAALIRLQGRLDGDENVEVSGFDDFEDVSFRETQVFTSTQPTSVCDCLT